MLNHTSSLPFQTLKFEHFSLTDLGIDSSSFCEEMNPLYESLCWDQYDVRLGKLVEPCRKRAVGEVVMQREDGFWNIAKQAPQPYQQSTDHGSYKRTLPRTYPTVDDAYLLHPSLQKVFLWVADSIHAVMPTAERLRVILTFLRTVARPEMIGRCALEGGPHYDGMDYIVSALVVGRRGILAQSGVSSVLTPDVTVLYKTVLQPGEGILQDDRSLMHDISNIEFDASSGLSEGTRDMIGVDVQILPCV